MSVSTALSNALSGLTATSRRAELVSDNVANALSEDFAGRDARLEARGLSGGVAVADVTRRGDPEARARLRLAGATAEGDAAVAGSAERLAKAVGGPGEARALAARAAALETAFARLADTPESAALQADAADAAKALAAAFVEASREVQAVRADADAGIARLVGAANEALIEIDRLNDRIVTATAVGGAAQRGLPALEDARDGWIDRLGEIVPVRTVRRTEGDVMIYAPGGAVLLEGRPRLLEFSRAAAMTADSTLASGALSGLSLDGRAVPPGAGGPFAGGALAAQFDVRDGMGPDAQTRLDALAADLVLRFQDPAVDPTLAPGDPGLFTDGGAAHDPTLQVGLAGRIALNAAADRAAGGDPQRLRDGLAAATPRPAGDPTLPLAMLDALRTVRPAPPGSDLAHAGGASAFAEGVSGIAAQIAADTETRAAAAEGRRLALAEAEAAARGVDVDAELADLLVIEQAYAANARVVSVADDLLRTLLEI